MGDTHVPVAPGIPYGTLPKCSDFSTHQMFQTENKVRCFMYSALPGNAQFKIYEVRYHYLFRAAGYRKLSHKISNCSCAGHHYISSITISRPAGSVRSYCSWFYLCCLFVGNIIRHGYNTAFSDHENSRAEQLATKPCTVRFWQTLYCPRKQGGICRRLPVGVQLLLCRRP